MPALECPLGADCDKGPDSGIWKTQDVAMEHALILQKNHMKYAHQTAASEAAPARLKYFEASSSLTRWECVKMIAPVVIFSIVLPLVDIITDLRTIILLYLSGHPIFASMFLGFLIFEQDQEDLLNLP